MIAGLPVGTLVGNYRIEEQIGRGGMGIVYRATEVELDRSVAIKVLAPELAHDPDYRERFKREARLAANLEHPNVVPIHATGEVPDEGVLFLVMRFVPGTDLGALIRRDGRLEPVRAATIVADVASALDAAHRRELVHRDVKPANILVSPDGVSEHVYLTDFGLTKALSSAAVMTRTGMWVGTVDYVAPEQLRSKDVDGRADIYSLGCVLYQTLTGLVPYPRDSEVAKMWAHISDPPPSIRAVAPELSEDLDAVVQKATSKEPADRFQTAGEMAQAAVKAARGLTTRAGAAPPPEPTKLSSRAEDDTLSPPSRRHQAPAQETIVSSGSAAARAAAAGPAPPSAPAAPPPAAEVGAAPPAPAAPPRERAPGRPRWPIFAGIGAAVVAAIVAVVVLAGGGGGGGGGGSSEPSGITVGTRPADAFALGSSVWVANQGDGTLSRIDAGSGKVSGKPLSGIDSPFRLGGSGTVLWAISSGSAKVARVETSGTTPKARQIDLPADPVDISVGEGAVWIASLAGRHGELVELDEKTGSQTGDLTVGSAPSAVAAGQGAVWVIDGDTGTLYRVRSGGSPSVETSIPIGQGASAVAVGSGAVWVADTSAHRVVRVDPSTNKVVARIAVPASTSAILATGGGSVWWIDREHGQAVRIDPSRNRTDGDPRTVGSDAGGGTLTAGTLWVTRPSSNSVAKIAF